MKPTLKDQIAARRLVLELQGRRLRKRARARPPAQLQPDAIRVDYYRQLRQVLQRARELVQDRLLPVLPQLVAEAVRARGDAAQHADAGPGQRVNALMEGVSEALFRELTGPAMERIAGSIGKRTSDFQRTQLLKQLRALVAVDLTLVERSLSVRLEDFTAQNVALIKSLPQQYLDQVEARVISGVRAGDRPSTIAAELADRYGVAESRAQLIANDQVGKFYGELQKVRQTDLGVKRYIWRSVRDNRVRDEHQQRDGESIAWDEPPEDGHPGEAVNCRCWAEPDLSELLPDVA